MHPGTLLRAVATVILVVVIAPARASADQTLLLEVVVNGHPVGKIGEFVQRDSELLARPGELRDLGIRVPDRAPSNQADLVPLSAIEGLAARLDMATQTLYVSAAPERLLPELLLAGGVSAAMFRSKAGSGRRWITMSSAPRSAGRTSAAGCSICAPSRRGAWFPRAS